MKHIFISILIVLLFIVTSCNKDDLSESMDDFFFLKNKGAEIPVHVRGNGQSNNFVIFLAGGPGASSYNYSEGIPEFRNILEKKCAMVYWDQRGCGNSQGHINESSITIDQFVEDLYKLICVVNNRYASPNIFLMGHSWGGTLGCAFLINQNYQALIKGFIYIDGVHNVPMAYKFERDYVMQYAPVLKDRGIEIDKMNEAIEWCNNNINIETKEQQLHIQEISAYIEDNIAEVSDTVLRTGLNIFFGEQSNFLLSYINSVAISELMWDEMNKINYSSDLSFIKNPVLIIWGKYDGTTPIGLGYDAFDNIGTLDKDKHMVIFENSGHESLGSEPKKFVSEVIVFLEEYGH